MKKDIYFIPPAREEVATHFRAKGYQSDPQAFFDYYSEGSWTKADGAPLKSWKRAAAGWENNSKRWAKNSNERRRGNAENANANPNQRRAYGGDFG